MDDHFVEFLIKKGFKSDETGYYYKKIGTSWLNCDCGTDSYSAQTYFELIATNSNGDDIFRKKYLDFDEFQSIVTMVIREERFKILLD